MKIAILSDIHANHIALQAVLQEATRLNIDRLFILGDVVGYYYHPDLVLDLLNKWNADWIQGNHEGMLKDAAKNPTIAESIRIKYGSGIQKALELLSDEKVKTLINLPEKKMLELDGVHFELCHGSPWSRDEYIYPDSSPEIFTRCAASGADFVFMGHSHHSFTNTQGKTILVNVGSVGQARDQGGLASWAWLDTQTRSVIFKHTPYDVKPLIAEAKSNDPHLPYLQNILVRNNG